MSPSNDVAYLPILSFMSFMSFMVRFLTWKRRLRSRAMRWLRPAAVRGNPRYPRLARTSQNVEESVPWAVCWSPVSNRSIAGRWSAMNILVELRKRFAAALAPLVDDTAELVQMVRRSQDARFGDYQANCAMPLAKQLKKPPRDVAAQILASLDVDDLCQPPEIAGPGFINLRIKDDWLAVKLNVAVTDPRLGVAVADDPRTFVIDYSSVNVAKPMHVGHIRSTVIGDSLYRTLKFLGHRVIGDNHLGDWGTQFGMIIYGYRHFANEAAYREQPVEELARGYRTVNALVSYHTGRQQAEVLRKQLADDQAAVERQAAVANTGDAKADKQAAKALRELQSAADKTQSEVQSVLGKLSEVENDPQLAPLIDQHPDIAEAVLAETAKLHEGDADNLRLWREFLPACLEEIDDIYRRLGVTFDHTLGESFYHDRLAKVVEDLKQSGIATDSDGAVCVFLPGETAPMIVRKKDGAFLYATTDLATIQYRMDEWQPNAILYVVDHRQSMHFSHLFAAARLWGYRDVELTHVSFGTVLGENGRPFVTRAGDTVGLRGLLDEAVRRALKIVTENDEAKPDGPELTAEQRRRVAEVVGVAALKYADLSHNRTSDYVFSYDKMLATGGNTATYMQYAYARVQNIFARGGVDIESLRSSGARIELTEPEERALAIELLRFPEALELMVEDYRPNQLTSYLFDQVANRYSSFYEKCPVLKADNPQQRDSRLLLCDLTARTLQLGLELLGIETIEKM